MIHAAIEEILQREGGYVNNPADSGGRTSWGISERWHPEAWRAGPPTREQAIDIYYHRYIIKPGFIQIKDAALRDFLVDWGVLSGPTLVIQKLQKQLNTDVDGVLGPITLKILDKVNPSTLLNQLIDERVKSAIRIAQTRPKDLIFLMGWVNRALSFREY